MSPAAVLGLGVDELKDVVGLSKNKASYIQNIAMRFDESGARGDEGEGASRRRLSDAMLLDMTEEDLMKELTSIKGIGDWTAHMFMMFHLRRPDVLPVGDLVVRKGMAKVYGLAKLPTPKQMEDIATSWSPFRSIGSFYMWRSLEPLATDAGAATGASTVAAVTTPEKKESRSAAGCYWLDGANDTAATPQKRKRSDSA